MKKLRETYKEIGIAFSFPIKIKDANGYVTYRENGNDYWRRYERDANGNVTYFEDSNDYWERYEYDAYGNVTYFENSSGIKFGTPRSAKTCDGKVVVFDGIKYKLKAL